MALQLIVSRALVGLVPVTPHDWELLADIPMGREFGATLSMQRSLRANRFYWSILGVVVSNHPFYKTSEALHLWIKTRLGYVEEILFHDGEIITRVKSTAFDKMDAHEWRPFMEASLDVLITEVLPGIRRADLIREVEGRLGLTFEVAFPTITAKAA